MIGENGREMKSFGVFNTRPVNQLSSGRALRQLFALFCILTFVLASQQTFAASLKERVTPAILGEIYPGAERMGDEGGTPPAAPVYVGTNVVGFVFSTLDIVASPGYSSVPFDVLAGVDVSGKLTGAKVIYHREPHIMDDTRREALLDTFLLRHNGMVLQGVNSRVLPPDFVVGATVTARAMRGAIQDSARLVLRSRIARPQVTEPTLDLEGFQLTSWEQLLAQGSIVTRRVTSKEMKDLLTKADAAQGKLDEDLGKPDDLYIQFMTGLFTPAGIGRNLLGSRPYDDYMQRMPRGAQVIAIASNGPYDFMGTAHNRQANGYKFDRILVVQGEKTFEFTNSVFQRLGTGGSQLGLRAQQYAALFALPTDASFDPLKPWRLDVLVHADVAGTRKTVSVPLEYKLPSAHILMPEVEPVPAWVEAWTDAKLNIIILSSALGLLTLMLAFQGPLTRMTKAYRWIRHGFLLFTLIWIGWIAEAQLSIINVINYITAPLHRFDWGFYLAEPLIVIMACYTALSLLLLGRGVFCGWLCPFGALQELLGQAARWLGLPQWNPNERLQRQLWFGKYISAFVVLATAFISIDHAVTAAELEPFKTAITSHFNRGWPYLLYAGLLISIGLFTERAYCRFMCPLGGVLALLDRLHLIDLLKRRPECGNPCHLCERSCPVRAIESSGKIKMAECFQCLDCQVEYYDDKRCPPLAKARKLSTPVRGVKVTAALAGANLSASLANLQQGSKP